MSDKDYIIAYPQTGTVSVSSNQCEAITWLELSSHSKSNQCWKVSGHKILRQKKKEYRKRWRHQYFALSLREVSWRYFHPTLLYCERQHNYKSKQGTEKSLCLSFSAPFCQAWYPSVQFLSVLGNQPEAGVSDIQQPLPEGREEAITKGNSKGIWARRLAIKSLQRSTILGDLQINRMPCDSTGAHQAIRIVWPSLGTDDVMAILSWLPSGSLLPLGWGCNSPNCHSAFGQASWEFWKLQSQQSWRSINLENNFRVL